MIKLAIYLLTCMVIFGTAIWALWFSGEDTELRDIGLVFGMSLVPIFNIVVLGITIHAAIDTALEPYKGRVLIPGRKRND